jgi:hypothetical protein
MGCQKKIAQEIHFTGGDHLLARKANHGPLHGEVAALFADAEAMEFGRTQGSQVDLHDPGPERGRGRIEHRVVKAADCLDWFEPSEPKHWLMLRSLVEITSSRKQHREVLRSEQPRAALCGQTLQTLMMLDSPE